MKVKSDLDRRKKSIIVTSSGIIFILLISIVSIYLFRNIMNTVDDTYNHVSVSNETITFNEFLDLQETLEQSIYDKLKNVATNIETDIKNLDMNKIEEDLNLGVISNDLNTVFKNNIRNVQFDFIDNTNENIFIGTYNSIVSDYNLSNATSSEQERTWDFEISRQYNSALAKNTIDKLLSQENGPLVLERDKSNNENHVYYDDIDKDSLLELYLSEGLEGFKNYTFLIPVYITKNGDIFGKEDIISGHLQYNNKLFLVLEYSLYDYIYSDHVHIVGSTDDEYTIQKFASLKSELQLFSITVIVDIMCAIIFLSVLSNYLYDNISTIHNNDKKQT